MRKTVRLMSSVGPEERLGRAIAELPASVRQALRDVADREDLPLVAGAWRDGGGGCLVANVVATLEPESTDETLDLRILRLVPELSSRELNRLIVTWDEAAEQEGRDGDGALRRLLRGALGWADRERPLLPPPAGTARAPSHEQDARPGGREPGVRLAARREPMAVGAPRSG